MTGSASGIDDFLVGLEEAHALAVRERTNADAIALLGGRVPQRHVRDLQRRLALDDAALRPSLALRVAALMLLHHVDVLDQHPAVVEHLDDGATPALVAARDHH